MPNQTESSFDNAAFLAAIGPILAAQMGGDGSVAAHETRSGTFNRVIKFTYGGRRLGVRVTLDQRHFRYERGIIKEVFAISLLNQGGERIDDAAAQRIVEALMAAPKGAHQAHDSVRSILYYDWSMSEIPYPFFIFEWIEGAVLWEQPFADHYHDAGKLLARLHKVRFESFYENILTIHSVPRSWRDHLRVCLNRELARAELNLPAKLVAHLNEADMSKLAAGPACLVHNDFSGANIVVGQNGTPHAIDWDNWVVDCPELDLVKMKYWTAIGREGRLTHRSGLFEAFLKGYQAGSDQPVDETRLRAYEHLWLLRCFNFEMSRAADDEVELTAADSWRQVYPAAGYYSDLLRDL